MTRVTQGVSSRVQLPPELLAPLPAPQGITASQRPEWVLTQEPSRGERMTRGAQHCPQAPSCSVPQITPGMKQPRCWEPRQV